MANQLTNECHYTFWWQMVNHREMVYFNHWLNCIYTTQHNKTKSMRRGKYMKYNENDYGIIVDTIPSTHTHTHTLHCMYIYLYIYIERE